MRVTVTLGVVLALAAGCSAQPEQQPGAAAPVGDPSATAAPPPSSAGTPSSVRTPSSPPARTSATPAAERSKTNRPNTEIRDTDWADVTIRGLPFCGESDSSVRFRDGSNGYDIPCVMLPGNAEPAYGDFLAEEPATEDALVLVELGNPGAARQQALVPVQLGADGRTRTARAVIEGDEPGPTGAEVMTFTAYSIDDRTNQVTARVKNLDGSTGTRRYRQANGTWEQI